MGISWHIQDRKDKQNLRGHTETLSHHLRHYIDISQLNWEEFGEKQPLSSKHGLLFHAPPHHLAPSPTNLKDHCIHINGSSYSRTKGSEQIHFENQNNLQQSYYLHFTFHRGMMESSITVTQI